VIRLVKNILNNYNENENEFRSHIGHCQEVHKPSKALVYAYKSLDKIDICIEERQG